MADQREEMISRERVLAALARREPDRVPLCENSVDRALAMRIPGLESFEGKPVQADRSAYTVEEMNRLADVLGLDNLFYRLRQPIYARTGIGKDGRAFYGDGMIRTEQDLERINLPDPACDAFYAEAEVFARGRGDRALFFVTRGGLAPTMLSMGFEHFYLGLHDDPGLVKRLLQIFFDWTIEVAKRVNDLGFDVFVTADDCAFKTGPMFSPQIYREWILPHYVRLAKTLRIPWLFHSDGDITAIVPMLIEAGVTAVHPFENTAMDIRRAKREFGSRICVMGNMDLNLLGNATTADVDREAFELVRDLAPGGGYISASGNSLAAYLKPECVLAYTRAVRKYGRYPIRLG
jgi:uroporphyrinogen decarboxylase